MAAPEALEQLSLVELTTQRLRAEILSGDLPPGARVVEEQLCRRYGISRAPLREALRLLAEQGLVEHLPRRGARVCDWSPTDIRQLFEIRHVLERHAVLSALPLTTGDGDPLAPVRERLTAMRAAENRGDQLAQDDAHRAFHAAVVGLAGNRQLELTLAPILLYIGLHSPGQGLQRHTAILAALESDVPQTVLDALDRHGEVTYLPSFIGLVHAPEVAWAANPQVALGYLLLGAVCLGYALIRRGEPAAAAGAGDPALHAEEAATPPAADAVPVGTPEQHAPRTTVAVTADPA